VNNIFLEMCSPSNCFLRLPLVEESYLCGDIASVDAQDGSFDVLTRLSQLKAIQLMGQPTGVDKWSSSSM
jgi:hypothetical protein